jgi:hypothetical protein
MGETLIAPSMPEEQPGDSFFSRALGVFIALGRTFDSIARRPDFLAPLITITVASIVLIEAMLQKIGAGRIIRHFPRMVHRLIFDGAVRCYGEKSWDGRDSPNLFGHLDRHRSGTCRHCRIDGIVLARHGRDLLN